jgi:ketopantoate reductase
VSNQHIDILPHTDFQHSIHTQLTMPTNILIVGAGAIGAFYASRLALVPGLSVSVICRSNYKAVAASGFQITSPQYGDDTFTPTHTFANPAEALGLHHRLN